MNQHDREKLVQAGEIARAVIEYARNIIRKGMSLKEIAERIERKIHEEGGKPAFPVNLSINDIAAHATPTYDDTGVAHGLLKVDIGVHIDGMIADTAFSIDLENNALNRNLILSAQKSLNTAVALARYGSAWTA
jgi:methionyl aminopeptidase